MKLKTPIIVILIIFLIGIVNASTITRTVPSTGTGDFTVTYQVSGVSGTWGASILDNLAGGCTFPDGTDEYKSVMLSSDGTSKSITVKRNGATSCSFLGDYKFGTDNEIEMPEATITFSGSTSGSGSGSTSSEGFCLEIANSLTFLQKITGSTECQTNTLVLLIGGVIILFIVIAFVK